MSWTGLSEAAQKEHILGLFRAWRRKCIIISLHACLDMSRGGLFKVFEGILNSDVLQATLKS